MVTGDPEGRTERIERECDRREAQTGRTGSRAAWWERRPLDSGLHNYSPIILVLDKELKINKKYKKKLLIFSFYEVIYLFI